MSTSNWLKCPEDFCWVAACHNQNSSTNLPAHFPCAMSISAARTNRIEPLQKKPPEDVQTLTMNLMNLNHAT